LNASLSPRTHPSEGRGHGPLRKTVAGPGDVNGDGYDDILIEAYAADYLGITNRGLTYLFFGNASGWQMNVSGANANASFVERIGRLVRMAGPRAGDVNGDGLNDIIIGAQYNSFSATYAVKPT